MKNLLQLSEIMVARQSAIRSAQVPLLSKLHQRMMLRARAVQVVIVTLSILGAWYTSQADDQLDWIPFNPIYLAVVFIGIGFTELAYRDVEKLVSKLPFFASDQLLAERILSADDSCSVNPSSRIHPIWPALQYRKFLQSAAFLIAGLFLMLFNDEHSTLTITLSLFIFCAGGWGVYEQSKVLINQKQAVNQDEELSDKYYFLIPYRWNYIYDYPRLLASASFSPHQRKKIESLYSQAFLNPRSWFHADRELCWYFWYDGDDERKDERTLPYRIPGSEVTI